MQRRSRRSWREQRWFRRWLDEGKDVSLLKAQIALVALADLRGGSNAGREFLLRLVDSRPATA
jgi:hypothetical protein